MRLRLKHEKILSEQLACFTVNFKLLQYFYHFCALYDRLTVYSQYIYTIYSKAHLNVNVTNLCLRVFYATSHQTKETLYRVKLHKRFCLNCTLIFLILMENSFIFV